MLICSVKGSNLKIIAAFLFCAVVIALFIAFVPPGDAAESVPSASELQEKDFEGISTLEDRVALLKDFGWEVESEAAEVKEVTVPAEFDNVYKEYNELQKAEGLDLSDYRGKTVTRYTYVVTNYDYDGTVYANLLVYKDCVIGGDICSANLGGFMHGLTKENDFAD